MRERERPPTDVELARLSMILVRRFVVRWDVFARQLDDGRYLAIHEQFNACHLVDHLEGRITLGVYLLNKYSQGRYLVFDADDDQQWQQIRAMAKNLYGEGIPGYLEESRRGGHLWLFLPISTSGEQIRRFARGLLSAHEIGTIEVFPKQDKLTTGPGSLIRLPFGIHQRNGKRYGFCYPTGEPLAPTIRQQIERLGVPLTVPLAAFKSYSRLAVEEPEIPRSNAAERPAKSTAAHADKDAPLSERLKAVITVRDFIEQVAPEVRLDEQGKG
jgi:hypothetical protein